MFKFLKIKTLLSTILLSALVLTSLYAPAAYAVDTITCANGAVRQVTESDTANNNVENLCAADGGVKPGATIQSSPSPTAQPTISANEQPRYVANDCHEPNLNKNNCGIIRYLVTFIRFLSAIVGIVIVAGIIIGGIQYSVSADEANAVNAAKKRIFNAVLALVVYIFMFALLQYLVPGGVF